MLAGKASWVLGLLTILKTDGVVPTLVRGELGGRKVLQVAAGGGTICVTEDGSVFAFGYNGCGQLGVGDTQNRLVPTLLRVELENKSVLQVANGDGHTMFVTGDGLVFACAVRVQSRGPQLHRSAGCRRHRRRAGANAGYRATARQNSSVCCSRRLPHTVHQRSGSLFAWAPNYTGQLGVGETEDRWVPTLVTAPQGKQVAHVAAGSNHTVCTTVDGSVFTWGAGFTCTMGGWGLATIGLIRWCQH